jgi:O-antigen ligase
VNARILVSGNEFSPPWRLDRQTLAATLGALALVCAAALVSMPKGFAVFGSLLLLATLLMPRSFAREWIAAGPILRSAALLALLALGLSILSMQFSGQGWRTIDHHARLLLVPWCGMLALAIAPSRLWLWLGAMAGVCLAFGMALAEAMSGVERVGAGSNPIVFANTVLALLVLAVYCRPDGRKPKVLLAVAVVLALGTAAIVLSGSRGVLPGLALVMLVALIGSGGRKFWLRLGMSAVLLAGVSAVLWTVPWLAEQTRLDHIQTDLQRYAEGHADTPIGARLEFLNLSVRALADHPWTGVGIDRFGALVRQLPDCRAQELAFCKLGHAHNDLAEWSATMGVPGLSMILAVYLLPFVYFAWTIRAHRLVARVGAAWAGLMLVAVYALSGTTQSMFAHAQTATLYAVFVGLLLGLSLRESAAGERPRGSGQPPVARLR